MLILVAHSDRLTAFKVMTALQFDGHTVIGPARSSGEAIVLARTQRPALALVDVDLETHEAGGRLARRLSAELHVPVILTSEDEHRAREHADTALGFLRKPFDAAHLPPLVQYASAVLRGEQREEPSSPASFELFAQYRDAIARSLALPDPGAPRGTNFKHDACEVARGARPI